MKKDDVKKEKTTKIVNKILFSFSFLVFAVFSVFVAAYVGVGVHSHLILISGDPSTPLTSAHDLMMSNLFVGSISILLFFIFMMMLATAMVGQVTHKQRRQNLVDSVTRMDRQSKEFKELKKIVTTKA